MIRKLAAALAASLLAAGAALAQPAGEQPATAPEVVYRIVQGGIEIGEAGLVLERDAAGITTSSRAELHGLVDVTAALRTGPDGAAESYGLEGTMRGVSVDLDATFHAGGVSFTVVQAGRESTLEVPSDEPLYVLDNLLLDGYQVLALAALERGEPFEVAAIVPQVAALGRASVSVRDGTTEVEAVGATVTARAVDLRFAIGGQDIDIVLWVDDDGLIVRYEQPGAASYLRVYDGEGTPEAAGPTAAEFLAEAGACVEVREMTVASAGETLYGQLSVPVDAPPGGAPALLLLPGSGAADVDGNVAPIIVNSGYRQLALALGCHGYAVLRVAKMGIPPSTGDANSATLGSYARNTVDWLEALAAAEGVDARRLGIIGHSEGVIHALYAVAEGLVEVDALVLIAGPGRTMAELLAEQTLWAGERAGLSDEAMADQLADLEAALAAVRAATGQRLELTAELRDNAQAVQMAPVAGFLRSIIDVDPLALAARVDVPAVVVQGLKDVQVAAEHGRLLASALPRATLLELPDLTHNLVDTPGPAEERLLPLPDDVVSPTLVQAIATALHGSLKLAR